MLTTDRLLLRSWRDDDLDPFYAMGQDRQVMAHFPALVTRDEAEAMVERIRAHQERYGFSLWAVEVRATGAFAGFCGLQRPRFSPEVVEVGWRLSRAHWGHGYATEGARAALTFGFETLALPEIVAFVVPANVRSGAVCQRLGMVTDPIDDFDHPLIAPGTRSLAGHDQRRHELYRIAGQNASLAKVRPFES